MAELKADCYSNRLDSEIPVQDFSRAGHTVVVSDIHLADIEKPHSHNHLWKRFKGSEHFIDPQFSHFLDYVVARAGAPVELVMNGDIFDFDSVMEVSQEFQGRVSWLEKRRGLTSEEEKSRFKMKQILNAHPILISALQKFVLGGNRIIFVIGNHDMELHWPSVQRDILDQFNLPVDQQCSIRFCEWFYISNQDTLIEHGNQYDAYCLCSNPIHPLIKRGSYEVVRLPFGNLAGKYMINGMGLMNPHASDSYIKQSVWEYFCFYWKYMARTQPLLLWTWLWSALITLFCSLREGFLPALRHPLTVDQRIKDIAQRSNTTVSVVIALKEVHVHPAIFNPVKILRELWLDRAFLLVLILLGSFQFFSFLNVFAHVSLLGFFIPVALLMPVFIFYARSVQSDVGETLKSAGQLSPLTARIAQVNRLVQGHTHLEHHTLDQGVEILNTGTWSPAYRDVECTQAYGRKCFAWIQPGSAAAPLRTAQLYEWKESGPVLIPEEGGLMILKESRDLLPER